MLDKGAVTNDTPTGLHCGKFAMGQPLGRFPHMKHCHMPRMKHCHMPRMKHCQM